MSEFCDQCNGPYTKSEWLMEQYDGHWDTCPNRSKEKTVSARDDLTEQVFHSPKVIIPNSSAAHDVIAAEVGFDFLLGMQSEVEQAWGRAVDPGDPEAVSKYIREVVLCVTDELHEVLGEVNWKPWKDDRGIKDVAKYREEMADVLHFILDLYLAAGLSGRDIVVDYLSKHYTNLERNKSTEYRAS